jgi:hypothetical protein
VPAALVACRCSGLVVERVAVVAAAGAVAVGAVLFVGRMVACVCTGRVAVVEGFVVAVGVVLLRRAGSVWFVRGVVVRAVGRAGCVVVAIAALVVVVVAVVRVAWGCMSAVAVVCVCPSCVVVVTSVFVLEFLWHWWD